MLASLLLKASSLVRLECYDQQHAFDRNTWFMHTAPRLRDSIKCLVLFGRHADRILTSTLLGVGRSLESLKLLQWCDHGKDARTRFNLPREMPNLHTIYMQECNASMEKVMKLFSRVRSLSKGAGLSERPSMTIPLRSLSFQAVANLDAPAILCIMQVNRLSQSLTTLRVQLHELFEPVTNTQPSSSRLPLQLLDLCPTLMAFSYTSPVPAEIFAHLPPFLTTLELAVFSSSQFGTNQPPIITSSDPFTTHIRSGRVPQLAKLSVVLRTDLELPEAYDENGEWRAWRRLDVGDYLGFGGCHGECSCQDGHGH